MCCPCRKSDFGRDNLPCPGPAGLSGGFAGKTGVAADLRGRTAGCLESHLLCALYTYPADLTLLLQSPNPIPDLKGNLDGVALLTEDLLVGSNGRVEPSPLTFELQVRNIPRDSQGRYDKTTVAQYELRRKLLLANPSSGGLVGVDPNGPAYLPAAGNDYTFASRMVDTSRLPILGSLRRRCEARHASDVKRVMTFNRVRSPGEQPPAVHVLRAVDDSRARYVAHEKMKRADFQSLLRTP